MRRHPRERLYFILRIVFSVLGLILLFALFSSLQGSLLAATGGLLSTVLIYAAVLVLYLRFFNMLLVGYLRGNGVRINERQFPEAGAMVREIGAAFGMKAVPQVFLIQEGGVLNAYAARFAGKNYIALYADVFEQLEKEPEVLKFILAHEMAHVRERHVQKRFWTGLSSYVPFLAQAYSRACEYSCDMAGHEMSAEGARKGLVMLAAGKHLYPKVDVEQYVADYKAGSSWAVRFVEKLSGHPNLPNRIENLRK